MGTAILAALGQFFAPLGQLLGLIKQRDAEKNTPAMVDRQQAANDAAAEDETRQTIQQAQSGDPAKLNDLRKQDS